MCLLTRLKLGLSWGISVTEGMLLVELNRVLRPGGYFLWSATPVYWKDEENVQIWKGSHLIPLMLPNSKLMWPGVNISNYA